MSRLLQVCPAVSPCSCCQCVPAAAMGGAADTHCGWSPQARRRFFWLQEKAPGCDPLHLFLLLPLSLTSVYCTEARSAAVNSSVPSEKLAEAPNLPAPLAGARAAAGCAGAAADAPLPLEEGAAPCCCCLALQAAIQARASATLGGTSDLAAAVTTRRREGCAAREPAEGAQEDRRSDRVLACTVPDKGRGWHVNCEPCGSCLVAMHSQEARVGAGSWGDGAADSKPTCQGRPDKAMQRLPATHHAVSGALRDKRRRLALAQGSKGEDGVTLRVIYRTEEYFSLQNKQWLVAHDPGLNPLIFGSGEKTATTSSGNAPSSSISAKKVFAAPSLLLLPCLAQQQQI